jgi:hypothetical protein
MSGRIRFVIDEDFDNDILRGVLRKMPDLDIVRVQDVGLLGASDPFHGQPVPVDWHCNSRNPHACRVQSRKRMGRTGKILATLNATLTSS